MPLILGTNSIKDTGGYQVANSLRFNKGSSDHLSITPSSAGSLQKYTFSAWVKRSNLGANSTIFGARVDANTNFFITFRDEDDISIKNKIGGTTTTLLTNRLFRDPSAWYHVVVAMDTTQGTASNRTKIYINGVQETSFATEQYPAEDANTAVNQTVEHNVGDDVSDSGFFNGYMAEVVFINNAQLAPTSFGEFDSDSGIWKPINVSGLTFGTNGFYLEFKGSGTSANASGMGADTSGNTNHFAVNNLTAVDQSIDTCTNNFATMNPLDNFYYNGTFSEGNLKGINGSGREASATATIAISNGKWFWEVQPKTNVAPFIGIQQSPSAANTSSGASMSTNGYGYLKKGKVETSNGSGGSTVLATYATYAADDIIGVAVDLDGNKIYFYKNGALQGSGVTITAASATTNGHYFAGFGVLGGQDTFEVNFGSPPFAISSGNQDGNGYGNFEYAVPSGYYALNTKNLAEYG